MLWSVASALSEENRHLFTSLQGLLAEHKRCSKPLLKKWLLSWTPFDRVICGLHLIKLTCYRVVFATVWRQFKTFPKGSWIRTLVTSLRRVKTIDTLEGWAYLAGGQMLLSLTCAIKWVNQGEPARNCTLLWNRFWLKSISFLYKLILTHQFIIAMKMN